MIGYPIDSHVTYDEAGVPVYDRAVSSVPLRKLIKMLFSDGVMPNPSTNLQVAAGTGMNVVVKPGFAICNGCMKLEEEQATIAVQAADASYDRIDAIVLRLDDNDAVRSCELAILTGTPSVNPTRPALTRNASVWEIGLADIKISANSTAVTNVYITDTRYETARCGVISSISEFDTTKIYQQILADLASFKTEEQANFLAWFAEMKNQLSTDAAGNLQNQIDVERERINNLARIEEGSTSGDAELTDIRIGANGKTYKTAGEAVRTQFLNMNNTFDNITKKSEFYPVTLADVTLNQAIRNLLGVDPETMIGDTISNVLDFVVKDDHCVYVCDVKKGDSFVKSNTWIVMSDFAYFFVTNTDDTIVDAVYFDDVEEKYTFAENGRFYISFMYGNVQVGEFFYIKRVGEKVPLVLEEVYAETYLTDSALGDETLNAILNGRQILVRIPNADGGNYTANYSPVYMYQLPNYDNNYLYLFYLKDEKETIDLSATGAGKVEMPIYGQLKMLLSKTYNADPLT